MGKAKAKVGDKIKFGVRKVNNEFDIFEGEILEVERLQTTTYIKIGQKHKYKNFYKVIDTNGKTHYVESKYIL